MGSGHDDGYSSLGFVSKERQNGSFVEIAVATRMLDSLMEVARVDSIDFISIDVEGHEIHVLEGLNQKHWKPRIVLLEDVCDLTDDTVFKHMAKAGYYRFYRTGANDWYARSGERRTTLLLQLVASGRFNWGVISKCLSLLARASCASNSSEVCKQ